MKRKLADRGRPTKTRRLQLTVQHFVEKAEGGTPGSGGHSRAGDRKKSRKELRKEKRLSKKIKRKEYYERRHAGPKQTAEDPPGDGKTKTSGEPSGDGELRTSGGTPAKDPKAKKPSKQGEAGPAQSGGDRKNQTDQGSKKKKKKSKISKEEVRRQALLEANEMEEKEIKRLERSLGMKRRRNKSTLPQAFTQDGLDYILGMLEPGAAAGLYDGEEEEEDTAKKINKLSEDAFDDSEGEEDSDGGGDEEMEREGGAEDTDGERGGENEEEIGGENEEEIGGENEEEIGGENEEEEMSEKEEEDEDEGQDEGDSEQESESDSGEEDSGEDVEDGQPEEKSQPSEDEAEPAVGNQNNKDPGNKYVPPHLRESSEALDAKKREELERLRKSVKGLMNRLSEPNLANISGQFEELYMTNSRKDMNDTVTGILLSACINTARMPDRLMMEHVLLISILHHTIGIEVGAHILETVVMQFYDLQKNPTESKECENLIIFIGHLYNFHVLDCRLIFDILKLLVATFTERDIELILLLLKNVGFSLRKDDPLALKELISEAQKKANAVDTRGQDQTRVKFMLETMLALKNNDMRKIPGYDPEPVEKLRKLQRTLVHSSVSSSDTRLRVSLENILEADKVGRWWIVGSSWSGAPMIGETSSKLPAQAVGKVSAKIMDLARKQRMNTDIRRNIFCVIMTSEDYLDAFEKLLKLGLKDHQEREIVHVLMDCCLQEKQYNPFYAFLASKFCEYDRRFQMTFQFSMWDKFRDLGSLSEATFSNLVQLLSHLIMKKSLPLSIFKVIEFSELDKVKVSFLRQILCKLLIEAEEEDLTVIFGKISDNAKLAMLREGLKLFISHFLLKNIQKIVDDVELLHQKSEIALKALQAKENKLRL